MNVQELTCIARVGKLKATGGSPMTEAVTYFGKRLVAAVTAAGGTVHGLALDARIGPSNVYGMLSGRRKPSRRKAEDDTDGDIEKIARVEWLKVSEDELKAWADVDRIGLDGIARLRRHVPELFVDQPDLDPILGPGARPLTTKEQEVVSRLRARYPDLTDIALGPDSDVWVLPKGDRLRELLQAERDLAATERKSGQRNITA